MSMSRRNPSKQIKVGSVAVGGGAPVSIQSMTNTDTRDAAATLAQIHEVYRAGCQIIRVTVPDMKAVEALHEILAKTPIPVIADIHFDYRLAIASIKAGVHAGKIIKAVCQKTGGNGGGRPDSAMAGGKDTVKTADALAAAKDILAGMLK